VRFRLGPLGAPVAIIALWIAVRVAVLAPWAGAPNDAVRDTIPALIVTREPTPIVAATIEQSSKGALPADGHRRGLISRSIALELAALPPAQRGIAVATAAPQNPIFTLPPEEDHVANGRYPNLRSGIVDAGFVPRRTGFHALIGSAWELVNGSGGAVGVPTLGGSQMGVRLYLQGARAPVGLTARFSHALGARDVELSAGYALRGHGLGLLVERRQRLDVYGGAFAVTAYGGVYDVKLPAEMRFDGFAQGGVVGVHSQRLFGDGQARVTRRAEIYPGFSLGAGGGVWASAQDGVRRVEIGPLLEMRARTGTTGLRIAGEYRFRVTGDARPRSGPAVTIGMDF
jgi:hypothetical protein